MWTSGNRWGPHGPPSDAYGRVTTAARFAPLHRIGVELIARLEREFQVERREGPDVDPELEQGLSLTGPSIGLAPRDRASAAIVIAFSSFPGVRVRFGRWCKLAFPGCGCDACDETAEGEAGRLTWLVDNLIAGRFRESARISADRASTHWMSWSDGASTTGEWPLDLEDARRLRADGNNLDYEWKPWLARQRR